ncbi:MAG: glucose-1-phosphate thymidylyltransferase [Chloroflexota bacterium]|nr:glucose-1-phosphate thymidylyltransferase [Chloroflexota bacterium]
MKAVILAAGQGTRLRPVTLTMPKPLVPVANQPLISYAIAVLKRAGLTEIGIVVNDLDSPIRAGLGDGATYGVQLTYIVQNEQRGLAHAIGLTRDFVGDEPFCVYLGDNIFQDKMEAMLRDFPTTTAQITLGLGEVSDPTRFGIALIEDGKIKQVIEKPKDPPSNLAIAGVYLFRRSIFDAIDTLKPSERGEYEITDAIDMVIKSGAEVTGYRLKGWWVDAGKPDSIIQANQLVLGDLPYTPAPEGAEMFSGKCDISHRVLIGAGSKIIDSVIRGPVIIGKNVTIKNSFIGPYTSIGDNVTVENSEVDASILMQNCSIRNIPGRIDSSLLADNAQVVAAVGVPATHRFILAENSYVQL